MGVTAPDPLPLPVGDLLGVALELRLTLVVLEGLDPIRSDALVVTLTVWLLVTVIC